MGIDLVADARLQFDEFLRQVDRNIALLAIDGIEFHGELESILRALPASVAGHASHCCHSNLNNFATWVTSLSPRPLMLTMTMSLLRIFFAFFITSATACADSSAGMIPSVREQY